MDSKISRKRSSGIGSKKPPEHYHQSRGHELNANETVVHKILSKAKQPMSAYDIIPEMTKTLGRAIAPPTVYRALQHLENEGLVSRIESKNAYVLCTHPGEEHDCLFFICRKCGKAMEAPDKKISQMVRKEAQGLGFSASKQILEVLGVCEACSAG